MSSSDGHAPPDGFAVFGSSRGVPRRSSEEEQLAAARDAVQNHVDAFVREHRGHADPLFYRRPMVNEKYGSLTCVRCEAGALATNEEFAVAADRQGVAIGPYGRDLGSRDARR